MSHFRRQAIIWTNAGSLLIGPLGTNFSEILKKNTALFIEENNFENVFCEKKMTIFSYPNVITGNQSSISHGILMICIQYFIRGTVHLTHLPPDKMTAISQTIFSCAFSWMKSFVLRLKFHWHLFLRVQLIITSIGSDNGLAPDRWHDIIWTNAYQIHWRIYAALGGEWVKTVNTLRPEQNGCHLADGIFESTFLMYLIHWCFTELGIQMITIKPAHKPHNALDKYPTMHHFVTEMCTFLLQNGAFWDME